MSSVRRHDHTEEGSTVTDDTRAFKKPFQTVDRPPVIDTDHNINDEYVRNPPHNLPTERGSSKESTWEETDPKQEGVTGDEALGKRTKENALADAVAENTIHSGVSGVEEIG